MRAPRASPRPRPFQRSWRARTAASPSRRCRRACSPSTTRTARARSAAGSARVTRSIRTGSCRTPARSLKEGALAPWAGRETSYFRQTLAVLAKRHKFSLEIPWSELAQARARHHSPRRARRRLRGRDQDARARAIARLRRRRRAPRSRMFMTERPCPACSGSRLRPESLGVKIAGKSIADVVRQHDQGGRGLLRRAQPDRARGHDRPPRPQGDPRAPRLPDERRARLPDARPAGGYLVGRRGAAHPAGDADRVESGGRPAYTG